MSPCIKLFNMKFSSLYGKSLVHLVIISIPFWLKEIKTFEDELAAIEGK